MPVARLVRWEATSRRPPHTRLDPGRIYETNSATGTWRPLDGHGPPRNGGSKDFGCFGPIAVSCAQPYARIMSNRVPLATGILMVGLVLAGCSSGGNSPSASPTSTPTTTAPPSSPTTTAAATTGAATCPTLAQANAALGASYSGPVTTSAGGSGIVCRYTSAAGIAAVAIFAHQSATVFAGQVANAPGGVTKMPAISGVGDGAYGATIGDRSIVNAYSNASRTSVAAQATSSLASVEALARLALADN